jgi:hypothetical protein
MGITMPTLIAVHEVDDVDHWLSSPKREELFGPLGVKVRTFRDTGGSNRACVMLDVPDMAAFQEIMESQGAADAMKFDGVRPETMAIFAEA